MNNTPPKVTVDLQKNSEISKIIADGIRAAEALEAKITANTTQLLNNPEIYPKGPVGPERIHAMRPFSATNGVNVFLRPPPPMYVPQKFRRPGMHSHPAMHMMNGPRPGSQQRPFILPQPSLIVSHYKKPPPNMYQRVYTKPQKGHQQPILLLGEASEIKKAKKPEPMDLPYMVNEKILMQRPLKEKPVIQPVAKITAYKPPFELRKDRIPSKSDLAGFKPDSVAFETGFRPIVRRRDETEEKTEREALFERSDMNEEEREEETFNQPQEDTFEPMFKPSPLESVIEVEKPKHEKLTGDLKEMNIEDGEDKMAMAAENYEQFNGYPEGSVVTYDGKAVLDTSLIGQQPFQPKETRKVQGQSKLESLLKKPQFGPFRGEIPPLIPEFANNYDQVGNPFAATKKDESPSTENKPISTKLTIVRKTNDEENDGNEERKREKRSPHHHPDHHGDGSDLEGHQHVNSAAQLSCLSFVSLFSLVRFFL